MKLRKCDKCKKYTLKEKCFKCGKKTKNPHYKFLRFNEGRKNNI